ncbi:MAG: hypothetical protein CMJ94_06895 [Planctomycetes bacterium]|nr:hypothetical protein [Planctomycetota bacterium]
MLALLLALTLQTGSAADSTTEVIQPTDWLVIDAIDERGRRPFREDAVFAAHLLRGGAPPVAGEQLTGARGAASWRAVQAEGAVQLRGRGAYAYTAIEVEEAGVYLAELRRGATLIVNGEATAGDVYRYGFDGYPVALKAGRNEVYVTAVRGAFELKLRRVDAGLRFGERDRMLPDLLRDEPAKYWVSLLLMNTTTEWVDHANSGHWEVDAPDYLEVHAYGRAQIAPLGLARVVFGVEFEQLPADLEEVSFTVRDTLHGAETEVRLRVRNSNELHRRTYYSWVDRSIQEYAVQPPLSRPARASDRAGDAPAAPIRLALSLHGAGVGCLGQAGSYQQKEDFWIVAPTNRRKFGFDWQDWGRRDAYDVLEEALDFTGVDPRHVYVTGHSMGGHGTWHLAANDPDGFAAAGPSAGWATFDTYGGRPQQDERWLRADAASLTLDLVDNLKQVAPFIIHGTADNNVPATQALTMLEALTRAGSNVELHMQGGAGHWWGGRCVDWPDLFDHFRRREIAESPDTVEFITVDPAVDAEHHWMYLLEQVEYGKSSRMKASFQDDRIEVETDNVRLFYLGREAATVAINGQEMSLPEGAERFVEYPAFELHDGEWRWVEHLTYGKSRDLFEPAATSSSPFKRAFDNHFLLVVGTQGDDERDAALLARARHDQAVWTYRGNGLAQVVRDVDVQHILQPVPMVVTRNLILYGNRDDNSAWRVLGEDLPIDFSDGVARLGEQTWSGDYAGLFVLPAEDRLVGVFASTSTAAARLGDTFAPFISGVGYPDYAIVGLDVLSRGDQAVVAAGWFDHAWQLPAASR